MKIDFPAKAQIPQLWQLWKEVFHDDDAFISSFEKTAFSQDRCRCVFIDEKIVAMLFWFDCKCRNEKIAYLYAVATKEAFRRQGLCRALMENTHKHLKKLGYSGTILVPAEESLFDYYKKLGYRPATTIGEMYSAATDGEIAFEKIRGLEYGALRRQFLPQGGVIQEKKNILFLQTMYEFYAGEGFLIAGKKQGKRFVGIEFLGDKTKAPYILSKLHCDDGRFRIISSDKPFSMYCPLRNDSEPPLYFGLAFD